jgi:hypothetical protein
VFVPGKSNKEVNRTESFPSLRIPWITALAHFAGASMATVKKSFITMTSEEEAARGVADVVGEQLRE